MSKEEKPKISVIMSVLNGEKYLSKGVESIINQSFTNWEFIICDDGSTDRTWEILQEYAKKDSRIILIRNTNNRGLAYSLNKCIKQAKSNILARQDADDESELNRFEIQYKFVLENPQFAIVGTSWYNIDENNEIWITKPKEYPKVTDMVWDGRIYASIMDDEKRKIEKSRILYSKLIYKKRSRLSFGIKDLWSRHENV